MKAPPTAKGTLDNPFVVYVGSAAGPFGKIEAGTDLGAGDKKSGGLADAGLNGLGLDDLSEIYYGGSGKTLRYDKEIAGAGIAISVDLEDAWAIGGEYAISDAITIGAGYDRIKAANDLNTLSFGVIGRIGSIQRRLPVQLSLNNCSGRSGCGCRQIGLRGRGRVQLGSDYILPLIYARNDEC